LHLQSMEHRLITTRCPTRRAHCCRRNQKWHRAGRDDLQKTLTTRQRPQRYPVSLHVSWSPSQMWWNMGSVCRLSDCLCSQRRGQKTNGLVAAAIGVEEERRRQSHSLCIMLSRSTDRSAEPGITNGPVKAYTRTCQTASGLFICRSLPRSGSLGSLTIVLGTVGDQLLITFARRLSACLRPGDTVARLGGEFAILLENIQEISDATHLASRLQQELSLPLNLDGHVFYHREHRHRPQYDRL